MNNSLFAFRKVSRLLIAVALSTAFACARQAEAAEEPAKPGKVMNVRQTEASQSFVTIEYDTLLNQDFSYEMEISSDQSIWNTYSYFSVFNLNAGATYYVRVRACNKVDYSDESTWLYGDYSDVVTVYTRPKGLSAVTGLSQVEATQESVALAWNPVEGADYYRLYSSIGGSRVLIAETPDAGVSVNGLVSGNAYQFYLSACAVNGPYLEETYESYLGGVKTTPKKVGAASSSWAKKTMRFAWDGLDNVDGYELVVYNEKNKAVKTVDLSRFAITHSCSYAKKNRIYSYKIRAYVIVGLNKRYGKWSDEKKMIYSPDVSIKRLSKKSQKVSWGKVKGATGYTVYRSTQRDKGYKKVKTLKAKATSVTFKKLNKKKTYYYRVVANQKVKNKTDSSTSPDKYYLIF